jgi:uncharacterized membrane protein HdeD (DUF308 family)
MATVAPRPVADAPANSWGWIMASGVLMLLGGIFSLGAPTATIAAMAVVIGWILLFIGIGGIVLGFRNRTGKLGSHDLLYGIVWTLLGLFILIDPFAGAASLTLAFAIWLLFRGALDFAEARRTAPSPRRGYLLLVGAVDWLLALVLLLNFPLTAVAVLGSVVGLTLLVGGAVTMLAAWQLRPRDPAPAA